MYEIPVEPVTHRDLWEISLAERLRMFREEPFKVAYFDNDAGNSSFRYRCFNAVRAINAHVPGVSAGWFWQRDGERLNSIVKEADVLVICRVLYSERLGELIALARRFGTKILFDVDDYVFDVATVPLLLTTLDARGPDPVTNEAVSNAWFGWAARLHLAMSLADEIVVTNDYLADRVRESFDKPVHVVPNFMGQEQLDYSQELVAAREAAGSTSDGFTHLGYFSGTPTHNKDFALVAPALARLMRGNDSVRLRIVGYLDLEKFALEGLGDRIEIHQRTDYMNLQLLIAETEINIAPLRDNPFTNCKSELKYFDAAAVAIPTLASPTFAMSHAIDHGVNGLLVRVDEWEEQFQRIVDDYRTTGVSMGRAARDHAVGAYSPHAVSGRLATLFRGAPEAVA